jgi:hypothetical protein
MCNFGTIAPSTNRSWSAGAIWISQHKLKAHVGLQRGLDLKAFPHWIVILDTDTKAGLWSWHWLVGPGRAFGKPWVERRWITTNNSGFVDLCKSTTSLITSARVITVFHKSFSLGLRTIVVEGHLRFPRPLDCLGVTSLPRSPPVIGVAIGIKLPMARMRSVPLGEPSPVVCGVVLVGGGGALRLAGIAFSLIQKFIGKLR